MSLGQALGSAVSGLRATQAGISLIAGNVANAEVPGYIRKTLVQETTGSGASNSVRVTAINRMLDQFLQRQLRVETSGAGYADLRAQFYQRLQQLYGEPGSPQAIESVYNDFTSALQSLSSNPGDSPSRSRVLGTAQALTQLLNGLTTSIQGLRSDAEQGLANSVQAANDAMQRIAQINQELATTPGADMARATLLDQRDQYIDKLSKLMDIRVSEGEFNQVNVFTNSGLQLVGGIAATLSFDSRGALTANTQWSPTPGKSQAGTISLTSGNGSTLDLLANNVIRSGQIAAYVEMRDKILVQAQAQIDEIAAATSQALSDRTLSGTPVTVGTQSGFDVDVGGLLAGNKIQIIYTDTVANKQQKLTIIRVDDPAALPLADSLTPDPNDKVIGVDWTGGLPSVITQLNSALNGKLQFSNPAGTTLRTLNSTTSIVNAVSAVPTVTSLVGGTPELPFFQDMNAPFSGAINGTGSQGTGFAGRITVNQALLADPSKLVVYQSTGTPTGDSTRPNFLYDRMATGSLTYAPQTGIGTLAMPFTGSIPMFVRQVLSQQGEAASAASTLAQGQDMVVNALKSSFSEGTSVNIDEEMANLIKLQTAYGASARVLTAVKDMIDVLLRTLQS